MAARSRLVSFNSLKGLTFRSVISTDLEIQFNTANGRCFKLAHAQDCCEDVYIESIVGDLEDLVDCEILVADEVSDDESPSVGEVQEYYRWTFYKLATRKGYVDIRWFGTSNGYYSMEAELREVLED